MHYLVTQCIDSIEQNAEYCWGIAVGQRLLRCSPTAGKALSPLLLADLAVLVIPEALKYEGVVQQRANAARELGPDQVLDQVGSVERTEFVQERLERGLLGKTVLLVDIGCVGGVEGDPQEDKKRPSTSSACSARFSQLNAR
jgi:hypothetical protein